MDCLKNLTACMGCTKKHAKCAWREVKAEELQSWDNGTTNTLAAAAAAAPMGYGAATTLDPTLDRRPSIQSDRHSLSTSGLTDGFAGFRPGLSATDEETYVALQRENQRARDEEGLTQARALALANLQAQNAQHQQQQQAAGGVIIGAGGGSTTTAGTPLSGITASSTTPASLPAAPHGADAYGGAASQRDRDSASVYSPPSPPPQHHPMSGTPASTAASSSIPTSAISEASFRPMPTPTSATDPASGLIKEEDGGERVMGRGVASNGSRSGNGSPPDEDATATAAAAVARAAGALSQGQGYGGGNQGVTA